MEVRGVPALAPTRGTRRYGHARPLHPRARAARRRASRAADRARSDVLASFVEDAAHFPGGFAAGVAVARVGSRSRRAGARGRGRAADRRAVVADRRRDAEGRGRAQHLASQPHRRRSVHDWVRVEAGVTLVDLDAALATIRPTTTRRCRPSPAPSSAASSPPTRRAPRRSSTDDARLGARADGRPGRTATCSTSSAGRRSRDRDGYFEIVLLRPDRARAGAALPDAGRAEGLGRLFRRAGDGPDRPVHRIGRHARRHHRGDAAGAAGAAGDVPGVRAVRRSRERRSRSSRACATRRARPGARGDPRGLDVSAIEHMDARCLALLREDGADRANGVTIPDGSGSRCSSRSSCQRA